MRPLLRIISFLAPDNCLVCQDEGSLLCESCFLSEVTEPVSQCYRCSSLARGFQTCSNCRKTSPLLNVWVAAPYSGVTKELLHAYKFDSRRGACDSIARIMSSRLPIELGTATVTHLPTNASRIRSRGFDQSALIAKTIAGQKGFLYTPLLRRVSNVHQVGATRTERLRQMKDAFEVTNQSLITGIDVIIVDDVMTTGASLEEAAKMLRRAGARRIYGLVFAH